MNKDIFEYICDIIYKQRHEEFISNMMNNEYKYKLIELCKIKQLKAIINQDQDRIKYWNFFQYYVVLDNKRNPAFSYIE